MTNLKYAKFFRRAGDILQDTGMTALSMVAALILIPVYRRQSRR